MMREENARFSKHKLFLRNLYYVLTRPIPVKVKEKIEEMHLGKSEESKDGKLLQPTDLSILRQSLLFEESRAMTSIF